MKPKSASFYDRIPPEDAIEALFRKHYVSLCKSVHRLLRDEILSEDIVQEVFLQVWERKEHLTFDDRFIFYLKKSCYHAALKVISEKRYFSASAEAPSLPSTEKSDGELLVAELENDIILGIGKLPEKTKLVFTLSRYEAMSNREIGDQLQISVKAVEKHMSAALRRLRESLKDYLASFLLLVFNFLK